MKTLAIIALISFSATFMVPATIDGMQLYWRVQDYKPPNIIPIKKKEALVLKIKSQSIVERLNSTMLRAKSKYPDNCFSIWCGPTNLVVAAHKAIKRVEKKVKIEKNFTAIKKAKGFSREVLMTKKPFIRKISGKLKVKSIKNPITIEARMSLPTSRLTAEVNPIRNSFFIKWNIPNRWFEK